MNTIDTLNLIRYSQLKIRDDVLSKKEQYEKTITATNKEMLVKVGNISYVDGMLTVIDSTIKLIDNLIDDEIKEENTEANKNA